MEVAASRTQHTKLGILYAVIIGPSEFAELNQVQRQNLWPYDYSFMRMGRKVPTKRLPNQKIKWWCFVKPNKCGRDSALLRPNAS